MSPSPFADPSSPERLLNDSNASAALLASAFEDAHVDDHVYRHCGGDETTRPTVGTRPAQVLNVSGRSSWQ